MKTLSDGPFTKDDTVQPFSNGAEWRMWLGNNCERGCKGCRNYNPDAPTSKTGCPIEVGLALGAALDGQVKAKHLLRGGILEPGENGKLVEAPGDASTWRCPEYRGYDEPDDRIRRGPRPPEGQMDLFDPRNAPDRTLVPA